MGYTRHWVRRPAQEPVGAYDALATDAAMILEACTRAGIAITGPDGTGSCRIDGTVIAFNGAPAMESFVWPRDVSEADDLIDLLSTSGLFERGDRPGFVKTERLPYDLAVAAVLRRAVVHYGTSLELISDDGADHPGVVELCGQLFPEPGRPSPSQHRRQT